MTDTQLPATGDGELETTAEDRAAWALARDSMFTFVPHPPTQAKPGDTDYVAPEDRLRYTQAQLETYVSTAVQDAVAKEREACAQAAEKGNAGSLNEIHLRKRIVTAIRARSLISSEREQEKT